MSVFVCVSCMQTSVLESIQWMLLFLFAYSYLKKKPQGSLLMHVFLARVIFQIIFLHPQVVYNCWTVAFGLGGLAMAKGTSSMLWVELVGQSESKERAWSHPRCCHSLQSAATFQALSLPPWLHLR